MRRISTTTRVSLCLASLAVGVILAADVIGLIPDASGATMRGRSALCEAVALQSSSALLRGDVVSVSSAIKAVVGRNPDILSAAIRHPDGSMLIQIGDHAVHWKAPPGESSTITHVRVPILRNNELWGTVEIAFRPMQNSGWGMLRNPLVRLVVFAAVVSFVAFLSYMYKVLQYLDPSMVIPERVKAMLDTLAEGVLVLDKQERILLANQAFARATGKRAEDLVGARAGQFPWQATQDAPAQTQPQSQDGAKPAAPAPEFPWRDALARGTVRTGAALCLERGDGVRTFSVNAAPIGAGSERVRGALVTFNDVTPIEQKNQQLRGMLDMLQKSRDEINRQNAELQTLAMTDPLTGCLNRRAFFTQFETQWNSARRYGHPLACVMVDVDHFKRVNDEHGHATGDKVLQDVGRILKSLARDTDVVCRYGGEEFCILMAHTTLDGAQQGAERFRDAIDTQGCAGIKVTASLGVSAMGKGAPGKGASSVHELLSQADEALYAAKRGGRNRVHVWTPEDRSAPAEATPASERAEPPHEVKLKAKAPASTIPFGAVTALMSVLAHRDKPTAAHSHRVADLCVATASGLLNAGDCFVLEVAALLHDIGKLGVPDSILLKPGPLTDQEWAVMRKHDRMGGEIVQSAFANDELTRIVRAHHAWYGDSPAAPAGGGALKGDAIPLAARILSVCDAYDAMISDRPYREGGTPQEAFAELRAFAGTQFDPAIVERVIKVVSTRAAGKSAKPTTPVEVQTIAGIQRELDRLAHALDSRDMSLLAAMAGRLSVSAHREGLPEVARLAKDLEDSASVHPEVADIVERINQLMTLCAPRVESISQTLGAEKIKA